MKIFGQVFSYFKKYETVLFLLLSTFIYLIFFKNLFDSRYTFFSSDARYGTFPPQVYLAEKLQNYEYPFWSERGYLGFSPYVDSEIGFLNPLNLIFTFFFGYRSLNYVHFFTYLIGVFAFYKLLSSYKFSFFSKLISILPFYFSFFHLNHTSHTMVIFISMFLPLNVWLVKLFIDNPKLVYLVLQGLILTIGLTWGHPQILLLNIIGIFLYSYFNFRKFKDLIFYFIFIGLFSISFSFYQIYPTFNAYLESERFSNELKYLNFSNFPINNITLIFPYLYGYYFNYQGIEISGALSFVETYNYIGVATFVFLVLYLIYGSKDRNYKLVITSIYFFILISSLKTIPLIENLSLPFIDALRYWTRSVYLFVFFLSFGIGYILNNKINYKEFKLKHIFFIFVFFAVSSIFSSNVLNSKAIEFLLSRNFDYLKKVDIFVWFLIGFTAILLAYLNNKKKNIFVILSILSLFIFDFRYFSVDFTPIRITRFVNPEIQRIPDTCLFERCLLENVTYNAYEPIATKAYNPYGYSQYVSVEFLKYYQQNIGQNTKLSPRSENLRPEINFKLLEDLGFKAVVLADKKIHTFSSREVVFFKENIKGKYLSREESSYIIEAEIPKDGYFQTTLRYSPNWIVKVNGKDSVLEKDGLFTKIKLNEGKNLIEIKFFPWDLVYGLSLGLMLLIITLSIYAFIKKRSLWVVVSNKDI